VAVVASTNAHVDQLNAAVQSLRLTVGDLDPAIAVGIAGGEHAHVGDVVATRRNDRHLTTTAGQPVRNRELWTVTATHGDGSLTVTHHQGHGPVTLPAEYVHQHVRLGYAATEHGYQSDTVTVGVNLASPVTTRRGLYVAVTRGRDENWIHVVTDSPDITEARDVLDTILAVDRADIPALTQRRHLAAQATAAPQPARMREWRGRCEIPDWFESLREHTCQELEQAEARARTTATTRVRLEAELDVARRDLDRLEEPTRRERERLVGARDSVDVTSRQVDHAQDRLDTCGVRGRRHARHDLAAATNRLTWANHHLSQVEASVSSDVEDYHEARQRARDLREALRHHDTQDLFDRYTTTDPIPPLQQRLDAFDTWWRFATGDSIDVTRFDAIVDTLGRVDDDDQGRYRWLAEAVTQYAIDAGLRTPASEPKVPAVEPPSLDIEL
jgi:hypothetical protein